MAEEKFFAIPLTLVLKHLSESTETYIANQLCQPVTLEHITDVKIFDGYVVKSSNYISRYLIQMVSTAVGNLCMDSSNSEALSLPTGTSLRASAENTLSFSQFLLQAFNMAGIRDGFSGREGSKSIDSKVNTNVLASLRQWVDSFVQDECSEIPSSSILGYRNCGRFAVESTRPFYLETSESRESKIAIL